MNRDFFKYNVRIKTKISGGREHYTTQPQFIFSEKEIYGIQKNVRWYKYANDLTFDEKNWNVLFGFNKDKENIDECSTDDFIVIPRVVIENTPSKPIIFTYG